MLQCMDILKINFYIVYRELKRELDPNFSQRDLHKKYILGLINAMIWRSRSMKRGLEENTITRAVQKSVRPTQVFQTQAVHLAKKTKLSKFNASLSKWNHCYFITGVHASERTTQDYCKYCKYFALLEKAHGPKCKEGKIKQPYQVCSICRVHLCNDHFDLFHRSYKF